MVSNAEWNAIKNNDHSFDGKFWYAVKTTKIFCKPSCPSRRPKRENIQIFHDPQEILQMGFRPCKRCRPLDSFVSNQVWVEEINDFLKNNFQQNITLEDLSQSLHGSQSYLRHVYKKQTGQTPQQTILELRLNLAKEQLLSSNEPVNVISRSCGFDSTNYFIRRFRQKFGTTPNEYRKLQQKNNS
ncbi:bifunctional transcriptional activator/DNA repair enzyme AdaA [Companilactobacillus sp.]|jgi:AraC family transcriptional regulator of adaptative response / methylphosphotriester-DNA alkyltransferase methyltransferase|uniref:bifunctional transcriptional activator/DNA repair enzyme AdaA n=1 Tax=Companilactobacillus sp. TaxID=2767905 RepID=UPI0025B8B61B|nr:bifunctional transcriptional activator/DNA repair enzyme AdaA [Companilactobacillus sp.]MCH4009548.1 bifunctional transcriptional activator/DNA repair enzyme AdaA [Companilactobacillus sp.]MCH4052776.1 bifunctional transcriptional activator/DNA repair enzyme AdaA [Companilactobacillus sp.]MCH4077490.1 bifunctional transcriptional activator/DNA repair enzyme AdaA [Companilactobacillus sp.]MCH4126066.1 bifunctional transcriptional activator/DNA repair enzyme AdaA [Companilactobacillus sp.]MCI